MKPKHLHVLTLGGLGMVASASADVIYSNFQDIAIPATFDGLYLNVETGAWNTPSNLGAGVIGWDINPFYGGRAFANSPDFQPVRGGTGSSSPILNLAAGASVGSGSVFSTFVQGVGGENPGGPGYGGSQMLTGAGGNFTSGTEGYLGFRLNGTDYGWMRVVLTNNTAGALIKDWAYDTSGAAVVVGGIQQVGQDIVLSSGFTLASALADSGGTTNLVKNGSGTNTVKAASTYTGATTVSNGTLLVNNSSGSGTGTGTVSVSSGATLGGTGAISGAVNVTGVLSPGASVETLGSGALTLNDGSTFAYEVDSSVSATVGADLMKVAGNLGLSGTVTLTLDDLAVTDLAFANGTIFSLINYTGTWNGGKFTFGGNLLDNNEQFTAGLNTWEIRYDDTTGGSNFSGEYAAGSFVNITVVPEPRAALLGGLGLLILLRRRR